jgi:hypothetical protein
VNVRAHASVVPSWAIAQTPASSSASASASVHATPLALPEQAATRAADGAGGLGAQPTAPSMLVRQVPATEVLSRVSAQASAVALPLHAAIWSVVGAHASSPDAVVALLSAAVSEVGLDVLEVLHAPSVATATREAAAR